MSPGRLHSDLCSIYRGRRSWPAGLAVWPFFPCERHKSRLLLGNMPGQAPV